MEALQSIDQMTKLGIFVSFASHPDLDPADEDDRLYLNILFGMAKRESAVTSCRVRGGMTSKLLGGVGMEGTRRLCQQRNAAQSAGARGADEVCTVQAMG